MTPANLNSSVIAHRNDRMGARIIAILNAIRISRTYDIPWFCGWTTGGRTHEECRDPSAIFDEAFVAEKFFDTDTLTEIYDNLIDLSIIDGSSVTQEDFLKRLRKGKSYLSGSAMGITVLPWEDHDKIAAALPLCMDALAYSAPVKAMIAKIDAKFVDTNLTALHIRRGDIIHNQITSNKLWPNKYIPREFYEVHLERLLEDPTTRVLVFSDTIEEVTRLKAKSDRVIGIADLFGELDLTSGARDFIELFAMSRCKRIYGPPSSAYSQTATVIGGGILQSVQSALSSQDYDRAMDLMTERLEQKSDLFINQGDVGQCLYFLMEHQLKKGDPGRAKKIINDYIEDGLDKNFAYPLLCELAVATNALPSIERVRDLAYQRPVYVDESIATVNAYSAINNLQQGTWDVARSRLSTAMWYRPLDPLVQGALCLGATAGVITPENFFPFDPAMHRAQKGVFPNGKKALADLNGIVPKGHNVDHKKISHPWEIVHRDWRTVSGKKLNRAYHNKSKIMKSLEKLERLYKEMAGSPSLVSAIGVLHCAAGNFEASLEAQKAAVAAAPDNPLFRKRYADMLFDTGDHDVAVRYMKEATEMAGNHPCYAADLAEKLWTAKRRNEAREIYNEIAQTEHEYIEIYIMTATMLRRDTDRTQEALDQLNKALKRAHGGLRIMLPKARLLMTLGQHEEAYALYKNIADWGLGTEHTFVAAYRDFDKINRLDLARNLIDSSVLDFDVIHSLVLQKE